MRFFSCDFHLNSHCWGNVVWGVFSGKMVTSLPWIWRWETCKFWVILNTSNCFLWRDILQAPVDLVRNQPTIKWLYNTIHTQAKSPCKFWSSLRPHLRFWTPDREISEPPLEDCGDAGCCRECLAEGAAVPRGSEAAAKLQHGSSCHAGEGDASIASAGGSLAFLRWWTQVGVFARSMIAKLVEMDSYFTIGFMVGISELLNGVYKPTSISGGVLK